MRSVMLVDDEYWTLQGWEKMFPWEKHGFSVTGMFEDAVQALEAMLAQPPELVLTDVRMPEMSGLDLIRLAREHGLKTLFVVVSGYSDFEYARGALKYGAVDYLLKPVSYEDAQALLARIQERLTHAEQPDREELPQTPNEQFNALLQYVRAHFNERLQLKALASRFFLNPTYCSELFNKKMGVSFSRYLNTLRVERCCLLLRSTARSVEEIALQAGFVDGAHFHKVFKDVTGETPGQYRRKRERS